MSKKAPSMLQGIKDAADLLGVAEVTLRRRDATGKFKARRHPINDSRVYADKGCASTWRRIGTGTEA